MRLFCGVGPCCETFSHNAQPERAESEGLCVSRAQSDSLRCGSTDDSLGGANKSFLGTYEMHIPRKLLSRRIASYDMLLMMVMSRISAMIRNRVPVKRI